MFSRAFRRYLFAHGPRLYVNTGCVIWIGKTIIDTKKHLDIMSDNDIKKHILPATGWNLLYYSPNVLLWPANLAMDLYIECIKVL